ncbi:MAG TPA: hypothetical protein VFE34_07875 [Dongiaceae bacterium]|jgi:hypothetical protein|nr:hypothetical protein [Dongiaceae bacterium]
MKLRLDLVLCAILVASAGSELVAPDALSAEPARCQITRTDITARAETEKRILSEGYTDVRVLAKGCDDVWHAFAFAEGDPVNLAVTPQGSVLTE